MSNLPRVMVGGPVRDREWSVPLWLGGLLGSRYPRELLSLVLLVNDSSDGTEAACEWWARRASEEGWARAEVHRLDLGTRVDNNARGADRDYGAYAKLRDAWVALRRGEEWLAPVDSDVQVSEPFIQALINFARRDGWDLLSGVIANNWAGAVTHGTNVLVSNGEGGCHHSAVAFSSAELEARPCLVTGAACVVRAELFDMGFGYLDAEATAGEHKPEDNIFCARLLQRGRRVGYVPGIRATHWHRPPVELGWMESAEWWARQGAYAFTRAEQLSQARLAEAEVIQVGGGDPELLREVGD